MNFPIYPVLLHSGRTVPQIKIRNQHWHQPFVQKSVSIDHDAFFDCPKCAFIISIVNILHPYNEDIHNIEQHTIPHFSANIHAHEQGHEKLAAKIL